MKRVIFGISPFSLLVSAEMKDDGIEVDAFTVNKDFLPNRDTLKQIPTPNDHPLNSLAN